VHAVLQVADLDPDTNVHELARTAAALEGVTDWLDEIVRSVDAARRSVVVRRAVAAPRHWRELFVAAPVEDRAIEGFIDLAFDDGDDLVVVDYKTDELTDDAAVDRAVVRYRPQAAAYALALEHTTGRRVRECVLLFTRGGDAVERRVSGTDLETARAAVRDWLVRAG
jgi:ATP-dependent helicase/nuclease subunit A